MPALKALAEKALELEATTAAANEGSSPPEAKRSFSFSASTSIPIPDNANDRTIADKLPFKALFSAVEEAALTGHSPHYFIPAAYWIYERGSLADKCTGGYQKNKLRGQFNDWVAAKGAPVTRSNLALIAVERSGKEGINGIGEPGVSIWLTLKK